MFKKIRVKLVAILVICLVAAYLACGSPFRSDSEDATTYLGEKRKEIREEQMEVRKYVKEQLQKYTTGNNEAPPNVRIQDHLFASMVLNAFDRPYEHVLGAISKLLDDESDAGNKKEKAAKPTSQSANRMLVEAYGKALEDSQKHSVLIQEQIRLHQEHVPNVEGKESQIVASMREWPLENLAQFEARLVIAYLNEAPSELDA